MKIYRSLINLVLCCLSLLPLSGCKTMPESSHSASIALLNGRIYTVNPQQLWAEAVVVRDQKVVFVGSNANAQDYIDAATQVVDLKGKLVLPGIHDTHLHPLEAGSDQVTCLLDETKTLPQMLEVVADCIAEDRNTETGWLLGWGHDLETLLSSKQSPLKLLDELGGQKPIAIMESTSHSVWVNSRALALAGITADTPNPKGGVILKDQQGNPNGVLLDSAGDLVFDIAFSPTSDLAESNYQGLLYGLEQVAKNGITSIVDARVYWKRGYLDAWYRALAEDQLTARTVLSLWAYPNMADEDQLPLLKSLYDNDPTSLLRVSQIKLYSDGILHNTTAALHEPYLDYFPEVGPTGLNYFDKKRLAKYTAELEKAGFDMHIHAIGDRGVSEALDAIEYAQHQNASSNRHRITHVEMVREQDKARFARLNVIADLQVAGDFTHPQNHHWVEPLIGERAHDLLPLGDLYRSGATITLSSDWDVSSLSPFVGMENALTRGKQSLPDLHAVIRAYTINGAYTMRQEDLTGSIEVGKYGDLIVVSQNIFEIPVEQISQTQVLMTILGGDVIYDAGVNRRR